MKNLIKTFILIVSVFAFCVYSFNRLIRYNQDKRAIAEYFMDVYQIPSENILDISGLMNKRCYPQEFIFGSYSFTKFLKMDLAAKQANEIEFKKFISTYVNDSIKGYPDEGIGSECRKVTYILKDGSEHVGLIYFKDNKFYWSNIVITESMLLNDLETRKNIIDIQLK